MREAGLSSFKFWTSTGVLCLLNLGGTLTCAVRPPDSVLTDPKALRSEREQMVRVQLEARDIQERSVLEAMRKVPRHMFMPLSVRHRAYQDSPVPIGYDQTISQPYVVAMMTETVRARSTDRALEVGTGSGYQAAVLAELVESVFTIEIIPQLGETARQTLTELGYNNVHVRIGDGFAGWPEEAPFDVILVTAAAPEIPTPLLDQLADGGRLVMPVGRPAGTQNLILVTRDGDQLNRSMLGGVRFVPLTGKAQEP